MKYLIRYLLCLQECVNKNEKETSSLAKRGGRMKTRKERSPCQKF